MSAVRVAYDLTPATLSQAGVGRYTRELRTALEAREDVELVPLAATDQPVRNTRGRIVRGLAREGVYYPLALGRKVRRSGAELLHCPAAFAPRMIGRPVVLTIQDAMVWRFPELFTRANVLHSRLLVAGAVRRATRIITSSEHARAEIVELVGADPARVRVTPLGVDESFRPAAVDRRWLVERFGIRARYLLAVGTLEPRKNLPALVRAFEGVAAQEQDVELVLVGAHGWKTGELATGVSAARSPVVETGHVDADELLKLYAGAACFVYPSLYEGFGLPPLEAMACGTPVVCSNRASLPEVVGDAALLVDPTDEDALGAALLDVLRSPQRADDLRRRGLERAARYSWQACASATVQIYRDALAEAGA